MRVRPKVTLRTTAACRMVEILVQTAVPGCGPTDDVRKTKPAGGQFGRARSERAADAWVNAVQTIGGYSHVVSR